MEQGYRLFSGDAFPPNQIIFKVHCTVFKEAYEVIGKHVNSGNAVPIRRKRISLFMSGL